MKLSFDDGSNSIDISMGNIALIVAWYDEYRRAEKWKRKYYKLKRRVREDL